MCPIVENVYVDPDGRRQTFEEKYFCIHTRNGKLCSDVTRKTEHHFSRPSDRSQNYRHDNPDTPFSVSHPPSALSVWSASSYADSPENEHRESGTTVRWAYAPPEITNRDEQRALQRRARAEADKQHQKKTDDDMVEVLAEEEEAYQDQIELGRAEARAKERAEKSFAELEKRKAEEREKLGCTR